MLCWRRIIIFIYQFSSEGLSEVPSEKGVYRIHNTKSGKSYIGKTGNSLKIRLKDHLNCLKNSNHRNDYLQKAFKKYGNTSFVVTILESFDREFDVDLSALEMKYIEEFNTFNDGYNLTIGGEGTLGHITSEETKKKQSEAKKGKRAWNKGHRGLFRHTEEYKENVSLRNKGMFFGETHSQASITEEDVVLICKRIIAGESTTSISKDYSIGVVGHIRFGRSWQHITKDYINFFPEPPRITMMKNRKLATKELIKEKYTELKDVKMVAKFFNVGIDFTQRMLSKKNYES